MFKNETICDLCRIMDIYVKAGELNGMNDEESKKFAVDQMRGQFDKFIIGWTDNNVTISKQKTKDLYPGYPY